MADHDRLFRVMSDAGYGFLIPAALDQIQNGGRDAFQVSAGGRNFNFQCGAKGWLLWQKRPGVFDDGETLLTEDGARCTYADLVERKPVTD